MIIEKYSKNFKLNNFKLMLNELLFVSKSVYQSTDQT